MKDMSNEEITALFNGFDPSKYEEEAKPARTGDVALIVARSARR